MEIYEIGETFMNQNKKEISLREKAIFVVALIFAVFHLYTAVTGSMIAIYQIGRAHV